jgi:cellulose synthase/poly-beta-1,6-N-acetylglucosamine synthase-like glycosyltransferase
MNTEAAIGSQFMFGFFYLVNCNSKTDMSQDKLTITILVPCYNEEKTIKKCVSSWLNQTHPANEVVVVNDCSTDGTLKALKEFKGRIKVVKLKKNTGNKSFVQEKGLKYIKTNVFIATDADTIMDEHFVEKVHNAFQDPNVAAFAGYVKSLRHNWLTACREIDYIIAQDLHKVAQNNINFLLVIPGCAGAFRTKIFKKYITFDHDTLTEDLDFTFKINKNNLKIAYDQKAVVFTQDPDRLRSYINQMRRWYSGNWQNIIKHIGIVKKPIRAMEVSLIYMEGLVFYSLMFLIPILNIKAFFYLVIYCSFLGITFGIYAAIKRKRLDLLLYSPAYVVISYVNAYLFLEQFVNEVLLRKKKSIWFHPERRAIT